jgi:hypothetical protein
MLDILGSVHIITDTDPQDAAFALVSGNRGERR